MVRRPADADGHRVPSPRPPLPAHVDDDRDGLSHAELVEALRDIAGLVDVTDGVGERPNFHVKRKPYLHFHQTADGEIYADVKVGGGPSADFEPVWASTPTERLMLLRRVRKDLRRISRK